MADLKEERQRSRALLDVQMQEYIARSGGKLQVQISSFEKGLQKYSGINIIRVHSAKSNLMILEDYMPIIGEIDGDLEIISKEEITTLKGVRGFFCHKHNVFFLLLKEKGKAANMLAIFLRDAEKAVETLRGMQSKGNFRRQSDINMFVATAGSMKTALENIGESEKSAWLLKLEEAGLRGDKEFLVANTEKLVQMLEDMISNIKSAKGEA
jgi:hypothetical protein